MPACKFTKKTLSHMLFHEFYFHFLRMYHDYFFRSGFEGVRVNHDSSKSTIFMSDMAFDVFLSAVFVNYFSSNIKLFALCFDMYFFIER